MQSQILRNQLYTRGSINHITNENKRDGTETIDHKNQNIDKNRSRLNVSKGITEKTGYQTWKKKLEKMKIPIPKQKTGNLGQIMITASPNFFKTLGWSPEAAEKWNDYHDCPKKVLSYFSDALKFFKEYLGEDNILSWHLHFDEATPHLDLNYIPVFTGMKRKNVWEKDENGRYIRNEKGEKIRARDENGKVIYDYEKQEPMINASMFWEEKGGKNSYRKMQDLFYEEVGKKYHLDRGEIGSKRKHKNHHEFNTRVEEQAKKIQENSIKIGRQDEVIREYRNVQTELKKESRTNPIIGAAIELSDAEIQKNIYQNQVKALLHAAEQVVPDKVKDIKEIANEALNKDYRRTGEKILEVSK